MNPWERFFTGCMPPLEESICRMLFDGFLTFGDYVKYGDVFTPLVRVTVEYTPPERQLTAGASRR